jgi:hypothetical protein
MLPIQKCKKELTIVCINFTIILLGVFIAINLSTLLGQTGDWGMFVSSVITGSIEMITQITYKIKKNLYTNIILWYQGRPTH